MNSRIQHIAVWSCIWWLLIRSHCSWIRWSIICLFTFSCAKRHFNASLLRLAETGRDTVASLEQRCQKGCLALSDLQLFNPVYASRQYLLNTLKTSFSRFKLHWQHKIVCDYQRELLVWAQDRLQESFKSDWRANCRSQHLALDMPTWMGTGRSEFVVLCIVWMKTSSGSDLVEASCLGVLVWRAQGCISG